MKIHDCIPNSSSLAWETKKLEKMCIMCTLCTAHVLCVHTLVVKIIYKLVYEINIHACIPSSSSLAWETKKLQIMCIMCTVCTAHVHCVHSLSCQNHLWCRIQVYETCEVQKNSRIYGNNLRCMKKLWPESRRRFRIVVHYMNNKKKLVTINKKADKLIKLCQSGWSGCSCWINWFHWWHQCGCKGF